MTRPQPDDISERRRIEDELLALGAQREELSHAETWNRARVRRMIGPAREAGIKVRDISRMTGLSTQTLHTWMRDLMRLIPDIHYGLAGPPPQTLEQAVLRTMGEDPNQDWSGAQIQSRIPSGWPSGNSAAIEEALENLARWHMIWDSDRDAHYRVAPPTSLDITGNPPG